MLGQIVVLFLVVWLMVLRWQRRGMNKISNVLGETKSIRLPFIGQAYNFLGTDEDRMTAFRKLGLEAIENGGVVTMWQGNRVYLMVADACMAEFLLKNCLEKDDTMECLKILTGNGSVFAPVHIWRPRRKVLVPTFSTKNMSQFSKVFSRQAMVMVNQLKTVAGTGDFSFWKFITTYSMDSICESTLGVNVNAQLSMAQPFLKSFEESTHLDSARLTQPWLHSDAVYKMFPAYQRHVKCRSVICDFVDKIIKDKRVSIKKARESTLGPDQNKTVESKRSLLELLIESSGSERGYSDIELREETLVLVLAGTDTSAVGSAFTTVMLSKYPDLQEKIYQELKALYGDSKRPIAAEDLPHMKYLDAFIRESLRLYPPAPIIVRKVTNEVTLPSGVTLVEDTGIAINIWAIQRNPKYWGKDADEFRPERFIDTPLKHPASFIAFSHGPRGCIGYKYAMMSMKTVIAGLIRQFRILPPNGSEQDRPIRLKFDVMMRDVDNYIVQLESRN